MRGKVFVPASLSKLNLEMKLDLNTILGPKPNKLWTQAERESSPLGRLTIAFRLITVALEDLSLAQSHAAEVAALCTQLVTTASCPGFWQSYSAAFAAFSDNKTSAMDLLQMGNNVREEGDK